VLLLTVKHLLHAGWVHGIALGDDGHHALDLLGAAVCGAGRRRAPTRLHVSCCVRRGCDMRHANPRPAPPTTTTPMRMQPRAPGHTQGSPHATAVLSGCTWCRARCDGLLRLAAAAWLPSPAGPAGPPVRCSIHTHEPMSFSLRVTCRATPPPPHTRMLALSGSRSAAATTRCLHRHRRRGGRWEAGPASPARRRRLHQQLAAHGFAGCPSG